MASKILNKSLPMELIYLEIVLLLLGVYELYEYVNGIKTENIIGFTYECVELQNFDKIRIKIKGQKKPLITNEELQKRRESGEKLYVEFLNPTITPYFNGKSIEDSFAAEDISFVKTE